MTTPDRASTARHFIIRAVINGEDIGQFDTRTGGETTAENAKHSPGSSPSMRVALGGPRDTADVTIGRSFIASRDHDVIRRFRNLCGLAEMSVSQRPLDKDGRPFGVARTWTGVLQSIADPDVDSNSGDVATFEITMTADGDAA